jgi:hypothetical protein
MGHPSEVDSGTSNIGLGSESAGVVRALAPRVRPAACGGLLNCVHLCIFNVGGTTVDEAWTELGALLPEPEFQHIVKLLRVTNASTHPWIEMWVRGDLGVSLVRELREMTRQHTPSCVQNLRRTGRLKDHNQLIYGGWRFAIWQSW